MKTVSLGLRMHALYIKNNRWKPVNFNEAMVKVCSKLRWFKKHWLNKSVNCYESSNTNDRFSLDWEALDFHLSTKHLKREIESLQSGWGTRMFSERLRARGTLKWFSSSTIRLPSSGWATGVESGVKGGEERNGPPCLMNPWLRILPI